jgi:hypothetical protein
MAGGHTDFVWNDLSMDVTWHRRKTESVIRAMILGKNRPQGKKKKHRHYKRVAITRS